MKTSGITRRKFLHTSAGLTVLSSPYADGSALGALIKPRDDSFVLTGRLKTAYETALRILNPTRAELEHGLELHRNSLVFDAYGKMPRAAVDGAAIVAGMNKGHSDQVIYDMTLDQIFTRMVDVKEEREEFENAWKASGVTCVFTNAGEEGNAIGLLLKRLAYCTYVTDMMGDFVIKAATPEDIVRAKKENKHAVYLTGNGVPLPQEWRSVEEELGFIRIFFQLGIRMMHLTYNRRNAIGDGCAEADNGGLSDFGKAVVGEMNRVGVIVDSAHSSWKTSFESAKVSKKPVVASHTTVAALNEVARSKPDHVIKAIADTGGYIGITAIPRFLGGTGDIAAFMKHVDYVVKKFGCEHVAIGFDTGVSSQYSERENRIVAAAGPRRGYPRSWESLWPAEPFRANPEMSLSLRWTNWPLLTVGMVQMGYSDDDIGKIIGGNAMRVARAALA